MIDKRKLIGLFIFFLLVPPIGYTIVIVKAANASNLKVPYGQYYPTNNTLILDSTLSIDNPSITPLKISPHRIILNIANETLEPYKVITRPQTVPASNKTHIRITLYFNITFNTTMTNYVFLRGNLTVTVKLTTTPSLLGYPSEDHTSTYRLNKYIKVKR